MKDGRVDGIHKGKGKRGTDREWLPRQTLRSRFGIAMGNGIERFEVDGKFIDFVSAGEEQQAPFGETGGVGILRF